MVGSLSQSPGLGILGDFRLVTLPPAHSGIWHDSDGFYVDIKPYFPSQTWTCWEDVLSISQSCLRLLGLATIHLT